MSAWRVAPSVLRSGRLGGHSMLPRHWRQCYSAQSLTFHIQARGSWPGSLSAYNRWSIPTGNSPSASASASASGSERIVSRIRTVSNPIDYLAPSTPVIPCRPYASFSTTALGASTASKPETPTTQVSWVHAMHPKVQPFLLLTRLDKPAGTWLLYLPCTFAIGMASFASAPAISITTTISTLALFGAGAVVMRGAGCIINDLWDMDIDKQVERTRTRPLASGVIKPYEAILFLGAHLFVGLFVLTRLNLYSIVLGASSLALVATYPLMKRVTYWPQAFLGLTFNWGALLGFTALITDPIPWCVAIPLYLSGVCWTLVYDTIYALQDKRDDIIAGVKSTAVRFGTYLKPVITAFAAGMVGLLAIAGYVNGHTLVFYVVSVAGSAAHLSWQILTLDVASHTDAAAKFRSNRNLGLLVLAGIALDWMWRKWTLYRDQNTPPQKKTRDHTSSPNTGQN
ncbi:4-hydroxybenzoate polyprenyl transferase [Batrachochytrium salamandrivorans]|nr:4-hydroxybenzoate polyprenyl transferase [Batrachochytrium salamandrivorans]